MSKSDINICLNCMEELDTFDVCKKCGWVKGTSAKEPFQLIPGIILNNRYIVGMVISMGGFGIIYHGYDMTLKAHIAIKEFYPSGLVNRSPKEENVLVLSGARQQQYKKMLSRFIEEGRTMAKFSSNPNIVKVMDYFEANKTAYIIMEYLEGCTLREFIKFTPRLSIDEVIDYMTPVMDALIAVHSENIIHRDINPNNIFLSKNHVKVIDFGSARLSSNEVQEEYTVVITPGYAPFEQYNRKSSQGDYTDVYAVAATMYRLLTGVVPEESSDRVKNDTLQSLCVLNESITPEIESMVLRGMAIEPKLRFKSMQDFKNALLENKVVKLPEEVAKRRRIFRIGLSILSILVLFSSIYYFNNESNRRNQIHLDIAEIQNQKIVVAVPIENHIPTTSYEVIIEKFKEEYTEVEPEIHFIELSNYSNEVHTGKYDVYRSDLVTDYKKAEVDRLYSSLGSTYPILQENQKSLKEEKVIPTSFSIPVLYLNRYLGTTLVEVDPNSITYNEYLEIDGTYDTLGNFSHMYIDENQSDHLIKENSGSASEEDIISQIESYNQESNVNNTTEAINKLSNNELILYVGDSSDYFEVQSKMGGNYTLNIPFESEKIYGQYEDTWSITPTNETRELASILFVAHLLNDLSQNYLYVQNHSTLPINEETLFSNYTEFDYLTDKVEDIIVEKPTTKKE